MNTIKMMLVVLMMVTLSGCSLPIEEEGQNPRYYNEIGELYRQKSNFELNVRYDQGQPVISWQEIKGWDNRPADKYVLIVMDAFGGRQIEEIDLYTSTFHPVPCDGFLGYQVVATVKQGAIWSKRTGIDTSQCLSSPRVQVISADSGIMVSWNSIPVADYYRVVARDPYTNKLLFSEEKYGATTSAFVTGIECHKEAEVAVEAWQGGVKATSEWQVVHSKYHC